jgi:hypothetical protein
MDQDWSSGLSPDEHEYLPVLRFQAGMKGCGRSSKFILVVVITILTEQDLFKKYFHCLKIKAWGCVVLCCFGSRVLLCRPGWP